MLERLPPLFKLLCAGLAALLLAQLALLLLRKNPVASLSFTPTAYLLAPDEPPAQKSISTNKPAVQQPTNSLAPSQAARSRTAKPAADLPPSVQARVERITQSEIFGPVVRPLPMALLGIAGKDVMLRAPNGQTGLLKEGEELGGIKLLRIGANRVLIEENGEQKELTLFSGLGSESLLPKAKGKANPQ